MSGGGKATIPMALTLAAIWAAAEPAVSPAAGGEPVAPATGASGPAAGCDRARPARPVVATVPVWLVRPPDAKAPPELCLGGGALTAAIIGEPNASATWQLRAETLLLARGRAKLDDRGWGVGHTALPAVLARGRAVLCVSQGDARRTRRIDILPPAPLRHVRATLRAWGVGVLDPCGLVGDALRAQAVDYADLRPQLQHDFFRGEIAILAGFDDANELAHACRQLAYCARRGAALVVLNPPAGFHSLGVRRAERPAAWPRTHVKLDAELTRTLHAEDFRPLSEDGLIDAGETALVLAWLETPDKKADGPPDSAGAKTRPARPNPSRVLVAARPLGRGVVLAATLPELADCYDNPAGRCMLSEIILWILKRPWRPKEHT